MPSDEAELPLPLPVMDPTVDPRMDPAEVSEPVDGRPVGAAELKVNMEETTAMKKVEQRILMIWMEVLEGD